MANQKKNTQSITEEKQPTIPQVLTPDAELLEKNAKLQSELDELKAMMEQLMESQKTQPEVVTKPQDDMEIDDEVELIPPNKMMNLTSLFYGGMTLQGANKPIRFEHFGMTRPVSFEDLTFICNNHRSLAENGFFFIHNKDAIKALYLDDHYKRFVNKQTIENIITLPDQEITNIFNNVTNELKETIIDVVIAGVKQHIQTGDNMKYSNRNKIELLSSLSGKNIWKIANDAVEEDRK